MSEKPIMFSTHEVRAILEGRKTQTRRVIKPQPIERLSQVSSLYFSPIEERHYVNFSTVHDEECKTFYAPYQPGNVLWVRETWVSGYDGERYFYLADRFSVREEMKLWDYSDTRWRPSIHMPRAAARIFLRVTGVRVERVREISDEDAIAEGFSGTPCDHPIGRYACTDCMNTGWLEPPTVSFMQTWDSLNAKRGFSWDSNPFVFVISFSRMEDYKIA